MTEIDLTRQMTSADPGEASSDFSLERLRLFVALVAHLLPVAVFVWTLTITSSISSSYYTTARDLFVGSLFVIGALFLAYEGHSENKSEEQAKENIPAAADATGVARLSLLGRIEQALYKVPERIVSRIGGVAAILAALFPTACDFCEMKPTSILHSISAIILFSSIVYFCLIAFPNRVKAKVRKDELQKEKLQKIESVEALAEIRILEKRQEKQRRRINFYVGCGWVIAGIMVALVVAQFALLEEIRVSFRITYIAETAAMELFGFAWLIATKTIPFFAHETERYHPMGKKAQRQEPQPALGSV